MNFLLKGAAFFALAAVLSCLLAVPALAQEGAEQRADEAAPARQEGRPAQEDRETEAQREEARQAEQKKTDRDEVFRPSEQISDDLPVSFPVDI